MTRVQFLMTAFLAGIAFSACASPPAQPSREPSVETLSEDELVPDLAVQLSQASDKLVVSIQNLSAKPALQRHPLDSAGSRYWALEVVGKDGEIERYQQDPTIDSTGPPIVAESLWISPLGDRIFYIPISELEIVSEHGERLALGTKKRVARIEVGLFRQDDNTRIVRYGSILSCWTVLQLDR